MRKKLCKIKHANTLRTIYALPSPFVLALHTSVYCRYSEIAHSAISRGSSRSAWPSPRSAVHSAFNSKQPGESYILHSGYLYPDDDFL